MTHPDAPSPVRAKVAQALIDYIDRHGPLLPYGSSQLIGFIADALAASPKSEPVAVDAPDLDAKGLDALLKQARHETHIFQRVSRVTSDAMIEALSARPIQGPVAWVVQLKYSDRWSGDMFTDVLPEQDGTYRVIRPLFAHPPAPPSGEVDETGWLIELGTRVVVSPQWWSLPKDNEGQWTGDSLKALRFARREDAEAYIEEAGWTEAFASEHMWASPRSVLVPSTVKSGAVEADDVVPYARWHLDGTGRMVSSVLGEWVRLADIEASDRALHAKPEETR